MEVTAETIQNEYERLGYRMGWRFITSPFATVQVSRIAVVGLNPGGDQAHGSEFSNEDGSAYFDEAWGRYARGDAPLQRQVQALAKLCSVQKHELMSAQFIPFRSPNINSLAKKDEAIAFASKLWTAFARDVSARLVFCLGMSAKSNTAKYVARAFGDTEAPRKFRTGWGNTSVHRYDLPGGRLVIGLPHLSTYRLLSHDGGREAIAKAIA